MLVNINNKQTRSLMKIICLKIYPKEHFWISGLKREFELIDIVPLYLYVFNNITKLPKN